MGTREDDIVVPTDAYTQGAGVAIRLAVRKVQSEFGLDTKSYDLVSGLLSALESPQAAERWASGEDVFSASLEDTSANESTVETQMDRIEQASLRS